MTAFYDAISILNSNNIDYAITTLKENRHEIDIFQDDNCLFVIASRRNLVDLFKTLLEIYKEDVLDIAIKKDIKEYQGALKKIQEVLDDCYYDGYAAKESTLDPDEVAIYKMIDAFLKDNPMEKVVPKDSVEIMMENYSTDTFSVNTNVDGVNQNNNFNNNSNNSKIVNILEFGSLDRQEKTSKEFNSKTLVDFFVPIALYIALGGKLNNIFNNNENMSTNATLGVNSIIGFNLDQLDIKQNQVTSIWNVDEELEKKLKDVTNNFYSKNLQSLQPKEQVRKLIEKAHKYLRIENMKGIEDIDYAKEKENYINSLSCFMIAGSLTLSYFPKEFANIADIDIEIGNVFELVGSEARALNCYLEAFEKYHQSNEFFTHIYDYINISIKIANILFRSDKYEDARLIYEPLKIGIASLKSNLMHMYTIFYPEICNNLANIYDNLGQYKKAESCRLELSNEEEKIESSQIRDSNYIFASNYFYQLAEEIISSRKPDYDQAIKYCYKAVEYSIDIDVLPANEFNHGLIYQLLGKIFSDLGYTKKVKFYNQKLEKYIEKQKEIALQHPEQDQEEFGQLEDSDSIIEESVYMGDDYTDINCNSMM